MRWELATKKQLHIIISEDRDIAPSLLLQAIEEAITRDTYNDLILSIITKFFGSLFVAEKMADTSIEDLKQICYIEMFNAWKFYKRGDNSFISFWIRFTRTKFINIVREAKAEKREINRMKESIYDQENDEYIQIVDDFNTEHQAINNVYLDYLFQFLKPKQLEIMQLMRKGYRLVDIEEILGENTKKIQKRFHDGKKRIFRGIGA